MPLKGCAVLCTVGESVDFVAGLRTLAGAGHPSMRAGIAIYIYAANVDMTNTAFYSSDGDMLIGTSRILPLIRRRPLAGWLVGLTSLQCHSRARWTFKQSLDFLK